MADPTFDEQMVTKLQAALLANPGAAQVTVDGQHVTYADAVERLRIFEARVARANGTRPRAARVRLG